MIHYVLGFLFSPNRKVVVMIQKTKPAWQKGLLNGVGGKIEQGETPHDAMVREFREETGLEIPQWEERFTMARAGKFRMTVFRAFSENFNEVQTTTEEEVDVRYVSDILHDKHIRCMSNMSWVLPLVLDDETRSGLIAYH